MNIYITPHALTRFRERVTPGSIIHNEKGVMRAMIDQGSEVKHQSALIDYGVKRTHPDSTYIVARYNGEHSLLVLLILRDCDDLGLAVVTVRTKGDRG